MLEANNLRTTQKNRFHFVLICDETGIFDAFSIMKKRLGSRGEEFITLIYSVSENCLNPLFKREITILEKRFSHNLYTHILKVEAGKWDLIQEMIEVSINSNTNLNMQFQVIGVAEFTDYVSGVLGYLAIDTFSIKSFIN